MVRMIQESPQRLLMLLKKYLLESIGSPANFPNYDSRSDLGLGKISNFHHWPRSFNSSYPYKDPASIDSDVDEKDQDVAYDDEISTKIRNMMGLDYNVSDFYLKKSTDNYYGTPTASMRLDMAKLGEAIVQNRSAGSISPIPNLYSKKSAVLGGANSWNASVKPIQHTRGTKRGYAGAPPSLVDVFFSEDEKNDENAVVAKIRDIVNAYHELNQIKASNAPERYIYSGE